MKKLFLSILFGIIACCGLHAQLSLGVEGGMNVSNYSMNIESKADIGYKAGIFAEYMFSPNFGIKSGAYITQVGVADTKGMLQGYNDYWWAAYMEVAPKYVQLPIALAFKFPIYDKIKIITTVGGYLAYGYGGGGIIGYANGADGIYPFEGLTYVNAQDIADQTIEGANRFDYGLVAGLGLEVSNVTISANYDYGLADVYGQYPIALSSTNAKNRVFWVGLGYKFKL